MPKQHLLRRLRAAIALPLILSVVGCTPTRLHVSTDAPQVKQVFIIAGSMGKLTPAFDAGDSRTLGDFAQNLPADSYDHATLRLAGLDSSANVWTGVTMPRTDWFECEISDAGDEVLVSVKGSAFEMRPDLCLGVVTLTDSASTGQRYLGTMIDTMNLKPTGFAMMASGPSLRVVLPGDDAPVWFKTD